MHTQCSLTFRKDGNNIENPYAHMLGRYMTCWQIHCWEHGQELAVAYRDFTGCSLMPGVPLKYMPGMRAGQSKEKEAVVAARHVQLSRLDDWEKYWLGADYGVTARAWRFINSGAKGSEEVALKHTPQFGKLLPENIQEDLDSYYTKLLESDPNFELDSSDSDDDDADDDTADDAEDDEDEGTPGSDTASVVRVEDDLSGEVEEEDNDYEMDEFDNDDTIVVHAGDNSLADNVPLTIDGNTPTGDRLPSPVDDASTPTDDVLQPVDDNPPPTNGIPAPTDNILPPIHDASSLIDNIPPPLDDVDDALTPIEDTPSPIDVDPLPLTNDGPPLSADMDSLSTPIDNIPPPIGVDAPPLMNAGSSPADDIPPLVLSQEDVAMHEPDQNAEVDTDVLTLSGMFNFPHPQVTRIYRLADIRYYYFPHIATSSNLSDVMQCSYFWKPRNRC